ncbi:MAG: acyl-CoA synthetase [Myxococcota bacterium]|nr:acyl-CoA synthetase [Myxococcota bacterium]MDP7074485.1 acyl-CoA synthetase [Myxococcota bacterium]MDP7301365.1 acyl-CoA synthetase [Myxococcota bacterium]MDP7434580.1 acyl-CoA synthetase [Myxococcota bacterium]HJO23194.1 acyl-CoA synthetase [Myxococcota bacterium]
MLNLAHIHESIAAAMPEREALVHRDRRFTWAQLTDRTRRLGDVLRRHGLGRHRDRAELEPWESGQDHVALYLYNGNEYLEGMLGAFKACCAPINVNYRYVDDELIYLFENSDARAVVYHAAFAPTLARIRDRLPLVKLWLQVSDASGEALLPGALDYEVALAEAEPSPPKDLSADDAYILYTGGTTGMPKGVLWRHEDVFRAALYTRPDRDFDAIMARARLGGPRVLPAPPFMHGAAHWMAFNIWHVGGSVVVPSDPTRLDPADVWSTIEREKVTSLTIVGDAFGRPLADELRRGVHDATSLDTLTTGGAILTATLKQEFLDLLPGLKIVDSLGSSESGQQASRVSTAERRASTGDFEMAADNVVLRDNLKGLVEPGSGERGWLARRGFLPLGYYKDSEKTAATFPVIDGVRYAVPGDRAALESDGTLRLFGREAATINTGGEKVFAEEVEHALKQHPAVYDAVVVGMPHERWGQQVTAVVRLREGTGPTPDELREAARQHLAAYKLPRKFVFVEEIVRAPSGKADYRWARERALAED